MDFEVFLLSFFLLYNGPTYLYLKNNDERNETKSNDHGHVATTLWVSTAIRDDVSYLLFISAATTSLSPIAHKASCCIRKFVNPIVVSCTFTQQIKWCEASCRMRGVEVCYHHHHFPLTVD